MLPRLRTARAHLSTSIHSGSPCRARRRGEPSLSPRSRASSLAAPSALPWAGRRLPDSAAERRASTPNERSILVTGTVDKLPPPETLPSPRTERCRTAPFGSALTSLLLLVAALHLAMKRFPEETDAAPTEVGETWASCQRAESTARRRLGGSEASSQAYPSVECSRAPASRARDRKDHGEPSFRCDELAKTFSGATPRRVAP